MSEWQTDCGEVDGEGEDDQRHDPEHSLHGSKVGVVDTGLCAQLKKKVAISEEAWFDSTDHNANYHKL